MEPRIKAGDVVKHFKRELAVKGNESDSLLYLYAIICIDGMDTETQERVVVYRALYGERKVFVRPYHNFMAEVDHEKYPQIKQKYRFETL